MLQTEAVSQRLGRLTTEHRRRLIRAQPQDDLVPEARELVRMARDLGVPDIVAAARNRYAAILLVLERYDEAIAVLTEALAVLRQLRQHDLGVSILATLAEAYGRQQRWSETNEVCARGIELVEQVRYRISAAYMQSGYLRFRMAFYTWGVRAAHALGDYRTMLERAELSKARATLRSTLARVEPAESLTELDERFRRVCARIDEARGRGEVPPALLAERRALWDLLCIERYRDIAETDLPLFSVERVQEVLAEDELVLYYYFIDRLTLLAVALDRRGIQPELRTLTAAERDQLDADADWILRYRRDRSDARGAPKPFDLICRRWYGLVPDLAGRDGARRLIVSPHGPLHALPFHAMPDDWQPLIERYAFSYAPNLSSLLLTAPAVSQPAVLAVGISDYAVPGRTVDPLPEAEREARAIAELYRDAGVPVIERHGAQARERDIQEMDRSGELARFSCLHLATHGINVPADTPLESYLYAHDSLIDGLEIAGWRLNADLVVLSACCAGQRVFRGRGMDSIPGDELFGLQAAFFSAGCRCIISALWPVGDGTAPPIMAALHRHLLAGEPPEVALQKAILEFLAEARGSALRIFEWAPFFLVRMGRAVPAV